MVVSRAILSKAPVHSKDASRSWTTSAIADRTNRCSPRDPLPRLRKTDGGRLEIIQKRIEMLIGTDIEDFFDDDDEDDEEDDDDEDDDDDLDD